MVAVTHSHPALRTLVAPSAEARDAGSAASQRDQFLRGSGRALKIEAGLGLTRYDWLLHYSRAGALNVSMRSAFMAFYAHAGFWEALCEHRVRFAYVAGASSGAIAGGLLTSGLPVPDVVRIMTTLTRDKFFDGSLSQCVRRLLRRGHLCTGARYRQHVRHVLEEGRRAGHTVARRVEACQPPFLAMVRNAETGRNCVWNSGPLEDAICASSALPVLFGPQRRDGVPYIDGGWGDPLAVQALDDKPGVSLYHHIHSVSFWDNPPFDRLARVPERLLNNTPNQMVCALGPLPGIHALRDLLWRNDLSAGVRAYQAALLGTRAWIWAPYQAQSYAEQLKICFTPSRIKRVLAELNED